MLEQRRIVLSLSRYFASLMCPLLKVWPGACYALSMNFDRSGKPTATFLVLFAALYLVTQLPLYVVSYPDIQDYVNHVARLHVAVNLHADRFFQQYYQWTPGLFPNMPLDTIGLGLAHLFGPELGVKMFASLAALLVATGCVALNWAIARRFSPLSLGGLLFVNGVVLYFGLFNFIFGMGLALWLVAAWIVSEQMPAHRRAAYFAVGATGLYLSHLAALGVFLVAVSVWSCWAMHRRPEQKYYLPKRLWLVFLSALPALLIHLFLYQRPTPAVAPIASEFLPMLLRKIVLFGAIFSKNVSAYPDIGAIAALVLILAPYWLWKRQMVSIAKPAGGMVLALFVCMSLLPDSAFGSALLDARLIFPIALIAWSGLVWQGNDRRLQRSIVCALSGLIVLASLGHYWHWKDLAGTQAELRGVLRGIPQGAKVAVVSVDESEYMVNHRISEHAAAWCVIDRSAFLSTLWARPYQPFVIGIKTGLQEDANMARFDQPGKAPTPIEVLAAKYDFIVVFGLAEKTGAYIGRYKPLYSTDAVKIVAI